MQYNCTIIDLHDRSVIASITDRHITSDLAIRTLQKGLDSKPSIKSGLILHSDYGMQYTSRVFIEFCESVNVIQSMIKAGYPYDNAPMERYFNTLKNECTNLCMNLKQKKRFIKRQKNLHMSTTIMCVRIVSMITAHHFRHEMQRNQLTIFFSHKCYKNA